VEVRRLGVVDLGVAVGDDDDAAVLGQRFLDRWIERGRPTRRVTMLRGR
jgi:hypothetical protein